MNERPDKFGFMFSVTNDDLGSVLEIYEADWMIPDRTYAKMSEILNSIISRIKIDCVMYYTYGSKIGCEYELKDPYPKEMQYGPREFLSVEPGNKLPLMMFNKNVSNIQTAERLNNLIAGFKVLNRRQLGRK